MSETEAVLANSTLERVTTAVPEHEEKRGATGAAGVALGPFETSKLEIPGFLARNSNLQEQFRKAATLRTPWIAEPSGSMLGSKNAK